MSKKSHFYKINCILRTSFKIPTMFIFSALWSMMLLRLTFIKTTDQIFTWNNLIVIVLVFNLLWVLRLIDEIKDYDYDKLNHPERALPSGVVTVGNIAFYITVFSILGIMLAAYFNFLFSLLYFLTILYGLFLLKIEEWSDKIKNNYLYNLIITYPVNMLVNISILAIYATSFSDLIDKIEYIIIPFFAFLHYEFARKTFRMTAETKGKEYYSEQIGYYRSLLIATCCGGAAVTSHFILFGFRAYHMLYILWILVCAFLYERGKIKASLYKLSAMIYILSFYLVLILI